MNAGKIGQLAGQKVNRQLTSVEVLPSLEGGLRLMAQQSAVEKSFSDERLGWEREEKLEGGQEHGEKRTRKILDMVGEVEELPEAEGRGRQLLRFERFLERPPLRIHFELEFTLGGLWVFVV